jgi:aspartyl-tRNA(Asn)/glutamyl-tRNA(Gln) amidotransferase subunit A
MMIATALSLAEAFLAGTADPLDVTETALAAAAAAPHGTFTTITAERARDEARAASRRWRAGRLLSPLDGVPVSWKDLYDLAGEVTTAGSATRVASPVATRDATLVAHATRAGLVCIGKTGLSEFAYSGLGLNAALGTPTNPDLDDGRRVPGGSSSGAAISIAAGAVPLALGTDTAGSVRIPAALNGLAGFRPSLARYPRDGVFPLAETLDTCGPLARTAADCAAFDALVRQADPGPGVSASLEGQLFVIDPELDALFEVSPEVSACTAQWVERLKAAGATISLRAVRAVHQARALAVERGWLGGFEAFATHRTLLDSSQATGIEPRIRDRLEAQRQRPAWQYIDLLRERSALLRTLPGQLAGATLLLPTVPQTAPLLAPLDTDEALYATTNLRMLSMTMPASLLDAPVVTLPIGAGALGLPIGMQLIRAQNDDDALLRIAVAVEKGLSIAGV